MPDPLTPEQIREAQRQLRNARKALEAELATEIHRRLEAWAVRYSIVPTQVRVDLERIDVTQMQDYGQRVTLGAVSVDVLLPQP